MSNRAIISLGTVVGIFSAAISEVGLGHTYSFPKYMSKNFLSIQGI